jgi:hypothetical protein
LGGNTSTFSDEEEAMKENPALKPAGRKAKIGHFQFFHLTFFSVTSHISQ